MNLDYKKMNILSLFDGMSVAQQALKDNGINIETYYASEIDEYAIATTQSNFPNTIQLGSVVNINSLNNGTTTINLKQDSVMLNVDIDLMIGGSPCQDLSIAKKDRQGLNGSKSGLFWEYVRIRNEVKPKYFILENVNSMAKEAKDIISEALGINPIMIDASLVSAQSRKRLFWIGKWNGEKYEQVIIPQPKDRGIILKDILESNVDEAYLVKDTGKTIVRKIDKSVTLRARDWKGFDNYGSTGIIRTGEIGKGGQADRIYSQDGKSTTLSANGGGRGAKTGLYCVGIIPESIKPKGNYLPRERVYSEEGKFRAVSTVSNQQPSILQDSIIRKLTPTECLRLQSMPDDYFDKAMNKGKPISNTQRYKMCGNAFNCEVIKHILKEMGL